MISKKRIKMMGTIIDLQIEANKSPQLIQKTIQLLERYKNRFSANDDDSELAEINRLAGIKAVSVHPDLFELINLGYEHSLATPSNLNIAIGPLVQTWRIGFDDAKRPTQTQINEALAISDNKLIQLNHEKQTVFLTKKGMKIDLGALAKGYIADNIMDFLKAQDITSALINLGGNVLVYGPNPHRPNGTWGIGIQEPNQVRGQHLGILTVQNQSVVTSGIYERQMIVDGQVFHHIFDKETGYPINSDMASLTIVADKSVDCEIWTTRLFGLPAATAIMIIEQIDHIEGIVVTKDNRLAISSGLKSTFVPY